jgi:cytochrome c551/c552
MKKIALLALLSFSTLLSAQEAEEIDGYDIYNRDCKSCHVEMISVSDTMKQLKSGKLKAPPMIEVSNHLKRTIVVNLDNEEAQNFVLISFIKEYLKKPDVFYSLCKPHAKEKFGIMPPQTQLTEEESQAVAEWIIDRYEDVEFK